MDKLFKLINNLSDYCNSKNINIPNHFIAQYVFECYDKHIELNKDYFDKEVPIFEVLFNEMKMSYVQYKVSRVIDSYNLFNINADQLSYYFCSIHEDINDNRYIDMTSQEILIDCLNYLTKMYDE